MRANSSRKNRLKKTIYIAVAFVVVIGVGMLLPRAYALVSSVVMTPVHSISQWFKTSEQMIPVLLRDRNDLLGQIQSLESELVVAKGKELTLRRLTEENNRLRNLMGIESETRIVAGVIARPGDLPYDLLQIDQGSKSGISENALVYAGPDQLIGSVSFVGFDHSLVTLFTSPGAEMTGYISGPDVIATVEGVGGGVARVRVPQGVPLTIGDLVYVPSVQPGLFGQIDFIESRPSQPEQFGYITLRVPLQSIYEVAISTKSIEPASAESIMAGKDRIDSNILLAEEANTVSFEELLATTTPTTTDEMNGGL
jgi:cell shape-determining protein MreC